MLDGNTMDQFPAKVKLFSVKCGYSAILKIFVLLTAKSKFHNVSINI